MKFDKLAMVLFIGGIIFLIVYFIVDFNQTNKCIDICQESKEYSVGYLKINGFDGEQLCSCYYPTVEGNRVEVFILR